MDSTEIGVLKQAHHVGFASLLETKDGLTLEAEVTLVLSGEFPDKTLERQLSDQKLCAFLILSNFSQRHCSWSESMRLLYSSLCPTHHRLHRRRLPRGLVRQCLARSFVPDMVLSCGLFCSCHLIILLISLGQGFRRRLKARQPNFWNACFTF